jgi:hypothetical protein
MLLTTFPVEMWLNVFSYLSTVDIIHLSLSCSYLYTIAGDEKKKRLDVNKFLSTFIGDVETFRHLMRITNGRVIGDLATAFFKPPTDDSAIIRTMDIVFCGITKWACLKAWYPFFRREGFVVEEDCSIPTLWTRCC